MCAIIISSSIELVVPAISETIALSSLSNVFNKVDFPTFGEPIIVTGIPFLITFPILNEFIKVTIFLFVIHLINYLIFLSANSTSSSEKSSSSSIRDAKSISFF